MNTTEAKEDSQNSTANDEDLIDTLIAISVVSKRLATKLRQENMEKEENPIE